MASTSQPVGQTVSHYRLLRRIGGGGMSILLILVVLTVVSVGSKQLVLAQQPHVVPLKKLSRLSMDKRYETVSGDPTKAGMPFVIRIHAEAGYIIMPHTHPEDENIVVVKGSWALGMGDRFSRGTLEPMEVGDFGFASKKMAHFGFSKTDTIIPSARSRPLYHAMGRTHVRANR